MPRGHANAPVRSSRPPNGVLNTRQSCAVAMVLALLALLMLSQTESHCAWEPHSVPYQLRIPDQAMTPLRTLPSQPRSPTGMNPRVEDPRWKASRPRPPPWLPTGYQQGRLTPQTQPHAEVVMMGHPKHLCMTPGTGPEDPAAETTQQVHMPRSTDTKHPPHLLKYF